MKRLRILLLSFLFLSLTIAVIFSYNDSFLNVKYYEAFEYVRGDKNTRKIIFINELDTSTKLDDRWHVKVYFNRAGEWVKFKNISPNNKVYEIIANNLSIKSIIKPNLPR